MFRYLALHALVIRRLAAFICLPLLPLCYVVQSLDAMLPLRPLPTSPFDMRMDVRARNDEGFDIEGPFLPPLLLRVRATWTYSCGVWRGII